MNKRPKATAIPVPVHLVPVPVQEKKQRKKAVTLETFVHRQMFTRHLAGLKERKNELCAGDLIAVLGPSREQPYRILKAKDFSEPTFRFQWYYQNTKDGWDLYEEVHEEEIGFATFLHWGFAFKGRNCKKSERKTTKLLWSTI